MNLNPGGFAETLKPYKWPGRSLVEREPEDPDTDQVTTTAVNTSPEPEMPGEVVATNAAAPSYTINTNTDPNAKTETVVESETETVEEADNTEAVVNAAAFDDNGFSYLNDLFSPDTDVSLEEFELEDPYDLPVLLDAQITFESAGNPNATSYDKNGNPLAKGLTQFIDSTWNWLIDKGVLEKGAKQTDVKAALKAQKWLMSDIYDRHYVKRANTTTDRWMRTLAAYQWGDRGLLKAIKRAEEETGDPSNWIRYAPESTKKYIFNILNTASQNKRTGYTPKYQWVKWGGILFINNKRRRQ